VSAVRDYREGRDRARVLGQLASAERRRLRLLAIVAASVEGHVPATPELLMALRGLARVGLLEVRFHVTPMGARRMCGTDDV
jgi:hypothetical protein